MSQKLWEKYPLLSTMSKLRASRFNAAERLGRRYRWHSLSLVIFSIYVIALSVTPQFFPNISENAKSISGFVSIVSSVFVVALSVYSAFSEDVVRGKYLHDNAKRVTNLYHQYKIEALAHEAGTNTQIDTPRFEREYATIMDACPYNHDSVDYRSAMIEIEGTGGSRKFWIHTEQLFDTYFWPALAILLPPLALTLGLVLFPGTI
jgi:hypothetical protein